jgi:hypothetical protein
MRQSFLGAGALLLFALGTASAQEGSAPQAVKQEVKKTNPVVLMKTTLGDFKIELFPDKAPITVANFLSYVDESFYTGTIFHRVIENFVIQGGGFTKDLARKETKAAIKNEATNALSNKRGTISMARLGTNLTRASSSSMSRTTRTSIIR